MGISVHTVLECFFTLLQFGTLPRRLSVDFSIIPGWHEMCCSMSDWSCTYRDFPRSEP